MKNSFPRVTSRLSSLTARSTIALTLAVGLAGAANAQQLPDAKSLFAKHNALVNGEAIAKLQSVHQTGTFTLPAVGLEGTLDIVRAQPNRNMVHITLPGLGEVVQGFDGKVGFTMNPVTGNTLVTGSELAARAEDGQFKASIGAPELFTSQETVEKTTWDGQDAYKVKLVWKSGRVTYDFFAVESGLRIGSIATQDLPTGQVQVDVTMSDYKQFGDVKFPTKVLQVVAGNGQQITITTVEFNKVEDSAFTLPPAIKALVPPQP